MEKLLWHNKFPAKSHPQQPKVLIVRAGTRKSRNLESRNLESRNPEITNDFSPQFCSIILEAIFLFCWDKGQYFKSIVSSNDVSHCFKIASEESGQNVFSYCLQLRLAWPSMKCMTQLLGKFSAVWHNWGRKFHFLFLCGLGNSHCNTSLNINISALSMQTNPCFFPKVT